jgi:tryptophan synthase alpha chain
MIAHALEHARGRGELALVAYVTAGFPSRERWVSAAREIVDAGADVLEIGIPFSDPIADGPTIQRASSQALASGTTLASVLDDLARISLGIPVCVMSYLNPLLALGDERAAVSRLAAACVSGLVVPDLPAEEAAPWCRATGERGLDLVGFVAPTSSEARIRRTVEVSDVLYYLAVTGTTGVRRDLAPDVRPALERLRRTTDRPVVVGFGIGRPEHVRALRGRCDGVVVGSRLVDAISNGEALAPLVRDLARAAKEG